MSSNFSDFGLDLSDEEDFADLSEQGRQIQESLKFASANSADHDYHSDSLFDFNAASRSAKALGSANGNRENSLSQASEQVGSNECFTFAGIRISKARVASSFLESRIAKSSRRLLSITSLFNIVKNSSASLRNTREMDELNSSDWVTLGVIVGKSDTRTSSGGKPYCILKLSDLSDGACSTQTCISLFLFGDAFRDLWKAVDVGLVVGVLNADILDSNANANANSSSGDAASSAARRAPKGVSLSVNTAQKVLLLGTSRDYAVCRAVESSGSSCWRFVNKAQSEFCAVHTMAVYRKFTQNRVALQLSYSGVQPRRFDVTNPQNAFTGRASGADVAPPANWKRNAQSQFDDDAFRSVSATSNFASKRGAPLGGKKAVSELNLAFFDERVHSSSRFSLEDRALLNIKKASEQLIPSSATPEKEKQRLLSVRSNVTPSSSGTPAQVSTDSGLKHRVTTKPHANSISLSLNTGTTKTAPRPSLSAERLNTATPTQVAGRQIASARNTKPKGKVEAQQKASAVLKAADGPGALNLAKFCLENSIQQHFEQQAGAALGVTTPKIRKRKAARDEDADLHSGPSKCARPCDSLLADAAKLRTRFCASQFLKSAKETSERSSQPAIASNASIAIANSQTPAAPTSRSLEKSCTRKTAPQAARAVSTSGAIEVHLDVGSNASGFRFDAEAALKKWKLGRVAAARESLSVSRESAVHEKQTDTGSNSVRKPGVETISEKKKRLLELLERGSRHETLTKQHDAAQTDRYFAEMETRDRVEQRLLTMHKQPAKIFTCHDCSYTSLSLFERCSRMRHRFSVTDGFRHHFECLDCHSRFTHYSSRPAQPCERCGSHNFSKVGAIRERSGPATGIGGESLVLLASDEDHARPPGKTVEQRGVVERTFEGHDDDD